MRRDVARVIAGDLNAFEGIVLRWQRRLVTMAWRFCRDRTTAEDMAQEVLLKTFPIARYVSRRVCVFHLDYGHRPEQPVVRGYVRRDSRC